MMLAPTHAALMAGLHAMILTYLVIAAVFFGISQGFFPMREFLLQTKAWILASLVVGIIEFFLSLYIFH